MESKVFEIRGHHLPHLRDFLIRKTSSSTNFRPSDKVIIYYGEEFFDNQKEIFEDISKGDSLVKITSRHDGLCNKCKYKIKKGCLLGGEVLIKEKDTAKKDEYEMGLFGIKPNKIYTGKEISAVLLSD